MILNSSSNFWEPPVSSHNRLFDFLLDLSLPPLFLVPWPSSRPGYNEPRWLLVEGERCSFFTLLNPTWTSPKGFKREVGGQKDGIISTLQCHHPCALSMLPPTQVTWCYGPSAQILYKMIISIFHGWSCVVILELVVM